MPGTLGTSVLGNHGTWHLAPGMGSPLVSATLVSATLTSTRRRLDAGGKARGRPQLEVLNSHLNRPSLSAGIANFTQGWKEAARHSTDRLTLECTLGHLIQIPGNKVT